MTNKICQKDILLLHHTHSKNSLRLFSDVSLSGKRAARFRQVLLSTILTIAPVSNAAFAEAVLVTNNSDSGAGSLRDAILKGNASSDSEITITFDNSLTGSIINLESALPMISNYDSTGPEAKRDKTWNITGPTSGTITIDGRDTNRAFFLSPVPVSDSDRDIPENYAHKLTVNISNMTIKGAKTVGGNGDGGGGGMGGNGGLSSGGGLGGNAQTHGGGIGSDAGFYEPGTWGGFGIGQIDPSLVNSTNFATGGTLAIPDGGIGGGATNDGNGGFGGGGSGAGNGGFGGGGGGIYAGGMGGNGGFGGGGGFQGSDGHRGGFGGGGGGDNGIGGFGGGNGFTGPSSAIGGGGGAGLGGAIFVNRGVNLSLNNVHFADNKAVGGNGGGYGEENSEGGYVPSGGGGGAMGGAIFVREGANITITGPLSINGSQVKGGLGASDGAAFGSGIFLQGNSRTNNNNNGITTSLTFAPGASVTQTIDDVIADQTGNGGVDGNAGSWALTKAGTGLLKLTGNNTYTGGTTINGGLINFNNENNFGSTSVNNTQAGKITLNGGGLQWAVGNTADISARLNSIGVEGAVFDTNGNNVLLGTTALSGIGGITKTGAGNLELNLVNTYTGLTQINAGNLFVIAGGSIAASSGVRLSANGTFDVSSGMDQIIKDLSGTGGTVNLGNYSLTVGTSNSTTYDGLIRDTGGRFIKQGTGVLTLTNANTYSGGTTINGGTLRPANFSGAGSGSILNNNSTLDLAFSNATFNNGIAGTGVNRVTGTNIALAGLNDGFSGIWRIEGSASVTTPRNLGSGTVVLYSPASKLELQPVSRAGFNFNNVISGVGTLSASMGNNIDPFVFGAGSSASGFTGVVELGQGTFNLSGKNTEILKEATLRLSSGNTTTVGNGTQTIGALDINGGKVAFGVAVPPQTVSPGTINTNYLYISSNGGQVQVTIPNPLVPPPNWNGPGSSDPLVRQDEVKVVKLINALNVSGTSASLTLVDQNGNPIQPNQQVNISQNENNVGVGYYGYTLSTDGRTGLAVSYGLTGVDIQPNQNLVLSGDTSNNPDASDIDSQLTGQGGVEIRATDSVTINNPDNDYTGFTNVVSGKAILGVDNALGNTSDLKVSSVAAIDMNGKTQTVGALHLDGKLDMAGGELTVKYGGTTKALTLSGEGNFYVDSGILAIEGSNPNFAAKKTVAAAAYVTITDKAGLGSGDIVNDGTVALSKVTGAFDYNMTGTGKLDLSDSKVEIRRDWANYHGAVEAKSASTFTVNANLSNTDVKISAGSLLKGNGFIHSLESSGTTAPGNSIGTMQIVTNFTPAPNHIYECEVDTNGNSDRIVVGGTATLNGILKVVPMAGNYQSGQTYTYTILTSGNLITTTFPIVSGTSPLFSYNVVYQPNAVQLQMLRNASIAQSLKLQGNAGATATAFDSIQNPTGAMKTLSDNLNSWTQEQISNEFNKIDMASTASIQAYQANNFFGSWAPIQNTLHDPLERSAPQQTHSSRFFFNKLVNMITTPVKATMAQLFEKTAKRDATDYRFKILPEKAQLPQYFRSVIGQASFWVDTSIKSSTQRAYLRPGTLVPEITTTTGGTQAGLDYQVTDNLLLGLITGYSHTTYRLSDDYGDGKTNALQAGIYGSLHITPEWYVDGVLSYGYNRTNGKRKINLPMLSLEASNSHHANQIGGMLETGYEIAMPGDVILTPMVHAGLLHSHEAAYTETGADTLGLSVEAQGRTYFQGKVAAQVAKFLIEGDTQFYGFVKMAYTYRKGLQNANRVSASFINQPANFTVTSRGEPDNMVSPSAGFTTLFANDVYITLGYNGDFGKNQRSHEGFIKIGKKF